MFGLPIFRLRWLLAAAMIAGGWAYVNEPASPRPAPARKEAVRKQERVAPGPAAALPARVAVPERRPSNVPASRSSDLVTAAIPKAPIPDPRAPAPRAAPERLPAPASRPAPETSPAPARAAAYAPLGARPLRKPQAGDCQCPYDLMIDGSACGGASAYVRLRRAPAACYH